MDNCSKYAFNFYNFPTVVSYISYNKDDILFKFRFPRGYQTDWIQIKIEIKRSCHLTYSFNVVTCNLKKGCYKPKPK